MRRWTEASFDAVAEFDHDLSERVVWLSCTTQLNQSASGSRHPVRSALARNAARLGRATALIGAAVAALRPGVAEFADFWPFPNRAKPILDYDKPLLAE